jgi:hypothetical protein
MHAVLMVVGWAYARGAEALRRARSPVPAALESAQGVAAGLDFTAVRMHGVSVTGESGPGCLPRPLLEPANKFAG